MSDTEDSNRSPLALSDCQVLATALDWKSNDECTISPGDEGLTRALASQTGIRVNENNDKTRPLRLQVCVPTLFEWTDQESGETHRGLLDEYASRVLVEKLFERCAETFSHIIGKTMKFDGEGKFVGFEEKGVPILEQQGLEEPLTTQVPLTDRGQKIWTQIVEGWWKDMLKIASTDELIEISKVVSDRYQSSTDCTQVMMSPARVKTAERGQQSIDTLSGAPATILVHFVPGLSSSRD